MHLVEVGASESPVRFCQSNGFIHVRSHIPLHVREGCDRTTKQHYKAAPTSLHIQAYARRDPVDSALTGYLLRLSRGPAPVVQEKKPRGPPGLRRCLRRQLLVAVGLYGALRPTPARSTMAHTARRFHSPPNCQRTSAALIAQDYTGILSFVNLIL